jgi:hypothetical protein
MDQMYGLSAWLVRFKGISFEQGTFGVACVSLANGGQRVYAGATHELQIFPVPESTGPEHAYWRLSGDPEMVVQFHGLNDVAAAAIPHVIANAIVKGGLEPRRRRLREWRQLIGGLLKKLGASPPRFV